MDVGVGILLLAVIRAEILLLPVLCGRYIYFRYNATFGDIVDNTTGQLDLDDMGIDVRICYYVPWKSRYDVSHKSQQTTNTSGFCAAIFDFGTLCTTDKHSIL